MPSFLIALILRALYSLNPRLLRRKLASISEVELDSAWQALRGFNRTSNRSAKKMFLNLYLEELSHFDLFKKIGETETAGSMLQDHERIDKSHLISSDSDLLDFLRFELDGERAAVSAMRLTKQSCRAFPHIQESLDQVIADEVGHIAYLERQLYDKPRPSLLMALPSRALDNVKRIWGLFQSLDRLAVKLIILSVYFLYGPIYKLIGTVKRLGARHR